MFIFDRFRLNSKITPRSRYTKLLKKYLNIKKELIIMFFYVGAPLEKLNFYCQKNSRSPDFDFNLAAALTTWNGKKFILYGTDQNDDLIL
ncbi:hypothetical protein BpHYR1_049576 [Brachionus plicatilis]|uniref:Uncharacterized protein n=1 Tax=Brachionus plicatilis TaxID=10195 RepID=A0A3M7P563_BRAPC|nr:hypothetical protein BpHYR1_049576 [Brachionus plicatilis]